MVGLSFTACRKIEEPSYAVVSEAKTMIDVAYGTDPKQKMDVYLPANRNSNTNVVIFVHGGSFIGGDKSEFNNQAKYLASRGYAVLNVNYRLVEGDGIFNAPPLHKESAIKIADQVNDLQKVVDFAVLNAKSWVMSSSRMGMAGHSAGATLALLYSYDLRNNNRIQVVANIAGALDFVFTDIPNWEFLPPYAFEAAYRYTGKDVNVTNLDDYKLISPLYNVVENRRVPTINIFPENNDVMGLPKMNLGTYQRFTVKLNEVKVPNEFVFMAGSDHGFSKSGDWISVLGQTVTYFNKHIK